MSPETTPVSLLVRVRDAADREAWYEFDARYRDLILDHCRRHGLQTADAEDVRQLVMLSLSRTLRSFRYDPALGRFRDYLGRVVRHAVLRALRRPSSGAQLDPDELSRLAADAGSAPEEDWEVDWMHHHLRLAMAKLEKTTEPASLQAFERVVAGESIAVVAKSADKSVDAIQKIMQRVRDRLREQVARQIREEEPAES